MSRNRNLRKKVVIDEDGEEPSTIRVEPSSTKLKAVKQVTAARPLRAFASSRPFLGRSLSDEHNRRLHGFAVETGGIYYGIRCNVTPVAKEARFSDRQRPMRARHEQVCIEISTEGYWIEKFAVAGAE